MYILPKLSVFYVILSSKEGLNYGKIIGKRYG